MLFNCWTNVLASVVMAGSVCGVQVARPDAPGRTEPERPIDASGVEVIVESGSAKPGPMQWAEGAVWYQIFPERFRNGWPLAAPADMADWYSPTGAKGYTDFPAHAGG